MDVQCSWCQQQFSISSESPFQGHSEAHYICADCIIPMLPNTLLVDPHSDEIGQEQRKASRIPLISQIYVSSKEKQNQIVSALITDMSDSGMKLNLDLPLDRGEVVTLGFLGSQLIYKAIGEVVRTQPGWDGAIPIFEVGVRLTGIHQDLR